MRIDIYNMPEDIIKKVNWKNWEKIFDEEMVIGPDKHRQEYMWSPDTMRKFIKAIVKSYEKVKPVAKD